MDRKDWIWVAIRIFGIYLLVLAVCSLPDVLGSAFTTRLEQAAVDGDPETIGANLPRLRALVCCPP